MESHESGIYEVLTPLYFPRNKLEESSALWQLPKNIGDRYGELYIPDRQIRIIRNPQHSVMIGGKSFDRSPFEVIYPFLRTITINTDVLLIIKVIFPIQRPNI